MTLGKKLSCYRKLAGMTQQQLGTHLNLSAQAISKWEKDLAEPDLSTLRALAELYKVTVDELLDPDGGFPTDVEEPAEQEQTEAEPAAATAQTADAKPAATTAQTVGFCERCGVVVNEESVGCTKPIVLCKKCAKAYADEQTATARKKKAEAEAAKKRRLEKLEKRRKAFRIQFILSLVIASLVTVAFLVIGTFVLVANFNPVGLLIMVLGTYATFAFVYCCHYKGFVQNASYLWAYTVFDKLLMSLFSSNLTNNLLLLIVLLLLLGGLVLIYVVAVILLTFVTAIVSVAIAFVCAPFIFPFKMVKSIRVLQGKLDPKELL